MIKYIFIILFFSLYGSANSQELKIIDGDTIKIDGETIRFSGIDTPETIYFKKYKQLCYLNRKKNYCGEISKVKLIEKIGNKLVICDREKDKDQWGRTLAECFVNEESLSVYLVKSGNALDWPYYSKGKFALDQDFAKKNKLGLWNMDFIEPWVWRKKVRNFRKNKSLLPQIDKWLEIR